MSLRLDRRTISRCKPLAIIRLARYIGIPNVSNDIDDSNINALIEAIVRKLDADDMNNSWPPKFYERKW